MRLLALTILATTGVFASSRTVSGGAVATNTGACSKTVETTINYCVKNLTPQVMKCSTSDSSCLCAAQTKLVTCYNSCANDPRRSQALQLQQKYCDAGSESSISSTLEDKQKPTKPSESLTPKDTSASNKSGGSPNSGGSSSKPSGTGQGAGAAATSVTVSATPSSPGNSASSQVAPATSMIVALLSLAALL